MPCGDSAKGLARSGADVETTVWSRRARRCDAG